MSKSFSIVIFLFAVGFSFAQQSLRFRNIGVQQGLSQSTVIKIAQDKNGFIWLGTQDGLNRYDGYNFRIYRHAETDEHSLSNNYVMSLVSDRAGNIWAGTTNGLNRVDGSTGELSRLTLKTFKPKLANYRVPYLQQARDGRMFFLLASDLCYADSAGHQLSVFKVRGQNLSGLASFGISGDDIFYTTNQGLFIAGLDGNSPPSLLAAGQELVVMAVDDSTVYYRHENRLHTIDRRNRHGGLFLQEKLVQMGNPAIVSVTRNGAETWVCTENGLLWKTPSDTLLLNHDPELVRGLSSDFVYCVFPDRSGLRWIGTSRGGISLLDLNKQRIRLVGRLSGLLGAVWSVAEKGDTLIIGTSKGISLFRKKVKGRLSDEWLPEKALSALYIAQLQQPLEEFLVTAVSVDQQGRLWAGTENNGVYSFDFQAKKLSHFSKAVDHLCSDKVLYLKNVNDSLTAVCSPLGLSLINVRNKKVRCILLTDLSQDFNNNYIMKVHEGQDALWMGTSNGVAVYDLKTGKLRRHVVPDSLHPEEQYHNIVADVLPAVRDTMWIATLGYGLLRNDLVSRKMQRFSEANGLSNPAILGLLRDGRGRIWAGTHEGISVLDPQRNKFTNYDPADGLDSKECTVNGFYRSKEGDLFFGTVSGLAYFNPDSLYRIFTEGNTVLTGIRVNYEEKLSGEGMRIIGDHFSPARLELDYRAKTLQLEFAGLNFADPAHVFYLYKLTGFDDRWVRTQSSARNAVYTNLPPGTYTFQVYAMHDEGILPGKPLQFQVRVIPPFWMTWWFRLVMGLVFISVVAVSMNFYFQRKLRKQKEQAENEKRIQAEKERISRELHDNVGSQLTYIIRSLDTLSYKAGQRPEKIAEELDALGEFSRETLSHLRESIWAINSRSIPLSELGAMVHDYITKIGAGIPESRITSEINVLFNHELKPAFAINCFRIIQEAVVNAVKHSGATSIQVIMSQGAEEQLVVVIRDNGKGLPGEHAQGNGHGLANMRARATEVGADISIGAEPGKGTSIILHTDREQYGK